MTDVNGLTATEAHARLLTDGRNELRTSPPPAPWKLLLRQLASPLVLLLIAAGGVSALLGEVADAIAIGTIVALNALIGYLQEARAAQAIQALNAMTAPRARVVRDGRQTTLPAAEVVKGDRLLLEEGDLVAADARLLEAHALSANEAVLTGESAPVEKRVGLVPTDAPLAERHDRVFQGTAITRGTGTAEVVATGMGTELGRIADLIDTATREPTPLERQLARVGTLLLTGCGGIVGVTAALGLLRGRAWMDVFLSAVSLAVAAVPEGLPALVTISLAVGVQRMAARNVLVRKLAAVETLGSADVICTDKTGTLTMGVMTVRELWGRDEPAVLATAAACCDAELAADGRGGTGDPTELAILVAARKSGFDKNNIERERPRAAVHPFDTERRRMSIFRADGQLYVKGAWESVAPLCRATELIAAAESVGSAMATRGLRVLAVAKGERDEEVDLRLVGLIGLADPPRPEAIDAVAAARRAGIRTIMITGDHPRTAEAIARELGIVGPDAVHARATPEQKLHVVRALKAAGSVVAMTGDGVNDAPALREAHIGIAMGKSGTEVTRQASDMVLADDNFASIVAAVREGRGIFENIRKTLVYLLAGNVAELAVMLGTTAAGLPLPLLPLHLLWINVVTDGLPGLALVMDPPDPDVMNRPPRPANEPLLGRREWTMVGLTGLLEAALTIGVFTWALTRRELAQARNLAFTTLVLSELFRSFAARSARRTLWEVGPPTNRSLIGVVLASAVLQLASPHVPRLALAFSVVPLSASDTLRAIALALVPVTVLEIAKLWRRRVRAPSAGSSHADR